MELSIVKFFVGCLVKSFAVEEKQLVHCNKCLHEHFPHMYLQKFSHTPSLLHSQNNRAKSAMTQRSMATIRPGLHTGIPKSAADLRNNIWLSDAGAYPIIFVLSFATCFAGSYITYCCVKSPDVRISTGRRQQLIRDWE